MRGGKRGLEAFSIEPDIGKGKGINEPINYGGSRHNTGGDPTALIEFFLFLVLFILGKYYRIRLKRANQFYYGC